MEANGQLLPKDRVWLYSPIAGKIEEIAPGLKSGSRVAKGQVLLTMFDFDLAKQVQELKTDIESLDLKAKANVQKAGTDSDNKGMDVIAVQEAKITLRNKIEILRRLQQRTNANLDKPGFFTITAPKSGIILTAEIRELLGRNVRPSDQLIRIGFIDAGQPKLSEWEIVLKVPHKHYGQVTRAFEREKVKELRVDVLSTADATQSYQARLSRDKIARQADPQKDDNNETEPVVLAWGRIDGDDIPAGDQIPPSLLLAGGEVHTRIRCGNHAMGYSLFYGVWEFAYEKVIFPYGWK
jgi:multidrug efflux pump subunit AcrA (membrane-fusion protein)